MSVLSNNFYNSLNSGPFENSDIHRYIVSPPTQEIINAQNDSNASLISINKYKKDQKTPTNNTRVIKSPIPIARVIAE